MSEFLSITINVLVFLYMYGLLRYLRHLEQRIEELEQ